MEFNKPLIMGIFNLSNESFYKNSIIDYNKNFEDNIQYCDIIDIGAESTHPGASPLSSQEEIDKLGPSIDFFKQYNLPISIDTYKSKTAQFCINQNINIINDISGGLLDENMFKTIQNSNISYILGHIQGKPENMQNNPKYDNIISDLSNHFKNQSNKLIQLGFPKDKIIIDPCIGFGKTLEHNISIIKNIKTFKELGFPILIGTSRKSMHNQMLENYQMTNNKVQITNDKYLGGSKNTTEHFVKLNDKEQINSDYELLLGTITTNIISIINGADIIRVHDPKEFKIIKEILNYLI